LEDNLMYKIINSDLRLVYVKKMLIISYNGKRR